MRSLSPWVGCLFLLACGGNEESTNSESPDNVGESQEELLEEYRTAIPTTERMRLDVADDPNALTVGGTSELAQLTIVGALTINAPAVAVVATVRLISLLPPTQYDADERRFIWGPYDNEEGVGQNALMIQKNDDADDFLYSYVFVRTMDDDLENGTAVIWGGATPGEDEDGFDAVGVTLWDVEANEAFEAENDPDYDPETSPEQGRFAMAYGYGSDGDGSFTFNVAAFRNFRGENAETDESPVDADYFYGHFASNDGHEVDFVDFVVASDLCDEDPASCFEDNVESDAAEQLEIFSAFFDRSIGRAEARISGGDLSTVVDTAECWDDVLDRTFGSISVDGEPLAEEGECIEPLGATLSSLGVPSLEDVDSELLDALSCVAENGIEACE